MSDVKQSDEPICEPVMITRGSRKSLSGKQVHAIVARRLRKIDKFSFLESFAMFMGKAQLVELGRKHILTGKYGYDEERIDRWTLGRVVNELRERGLRQDFIHLMEELKEHRNHIAHEMLANDALLRRLAGGSAQRIAWKSLRRGLYLVFSRTGDCGTRFSFWRRRASLMWLQTQDGSIVDKTGKVIFFSTERFVKDICHGGCCFICGVEPSSVPFNDEHILPNWLLRKYDLHNHTITLPNGEEVKYGGYTIPCCESCNQLMGQSSKRRFVTQ